MGTSASSKGPAGGVPMVPPWVPDLPPTTPDGDGDASPPADNGGEPAELSPNQNADALPQAPLPDRPMAPAARFTGARRNLGSFAKTGNSGDMRHGLGQYVRSGYGGARTATRRFGGTASTAGALHGALYALAQGQPAGPDGQLNRTLLQGRSAREVVDAVVEALRPTDGTQDTEAARVSIKDALAELLTMFPQADLLSLSDEQRAFAIERYIANDIYQRFDLDLGKTIQDKAPSATVALSRLKEVKNYIKETVAAAFRQNTVAGVRPTKDNINNIVRATLQETFEVFESYAS